ncbi:DMT family transporter [uncultured Friedmanniella sp.]|uniref:DMT family transporter n=1 Tax=uncultured Friedmanniella sp. TaxID=335381 RepID=UPI0035CA2397
MSSPRDWRLLVAVGITVLAWASAFVVIRYVGPHFSPGSLTLGRLLVGSVVLTLSMVGRRRVRLGRREWALVALIGVAWFGVYNLALNAGERHVDAGTAAMLIQVAPILIGALAGLVLAEGFPPMLVIGGLVAFAGTLVIGVASGAFGSATSTGDADVAGVLLVLLSAVVYSVAMVAQKVVLRRVPGLQVTWLACLVGTVVTLPFAGQLLHEVAAAPTRSVLGVVYLGVVPTALAFSTWAFALSRTTAGQLGVTTYAVPPIAITLGWLLLGEVPALLAMLGGVLSLVGVAIARRPSRPVALP